MDITQQLDPIGMSMTVTEGTQMNSGGYMDTSTLTLSAEGNSEGRITARLKCRTATPKCGTVSYKPAIGFTEEIHRNLLS